MDLTRALTGTPTTAAAAAAAARTGPAVVTGFGALAHLVSRGLSPGALVPSAPGGGARICEGCVPRAWGLGLGTPAARGARGDRRAIDLGARAPGPLDRTLGRLPFGALLRGRGRGGGLACRGCWRALGLAGVGGVRSLTLGAIGGPSGPAGPSGLGGLVTVPAREEMLIVDDRVGARPCLRGGAGRSALGRRLIPAGRLLPPTVRRLAGLSRALGLGSRLAWAIPASTPIAAAPA